MAGDQYFQEAVSYVERYSLYKEALKIWEGTNHYHVCLDVMGAIWKTHMPVQDILIVYGDWFYERREWRQASSGEHSLMESLMESRSGF